MEGDAFERAHAALDATFDSGAVPDRGAGEESPRGVEAVRAVMREGGLWSVARVYREIMDRGWIDADVQHPRKAVETAVNRLHGKYGEIQRVGRGLYRYKTAPTDQASLNGNGSAEP